MKGLAFQIHAVLHTGRTSGAVLLMCVLAALPVHNAVAAAHFVDVPEASIAAQGERLILPQEYRTVTADPAHLGAFLSTLPAEDSVASRPVMTLPLPDGTSERFAVYESPIMHPELAARHPQITTYAGRGIEDPTAFVRFDLTPHGFHAMILSAQSTVYIDPYQRGDVANYLVYDRQHYARGSEFAVPPCEVLDTDSPIARELGVLVDQGAAQGLLTGEELRTYRLAVAATGEYTIFHGGSVAAGLAAIVTAMNRVNGVYERDVSIRMELISNNDLIVYTNPATDPYTNSSGFTMLSQNQSNLDAVIGSANYDIGHVFSTGGGGVASLAVVCRAGSKARGVTGLPQPIGDVFYIDYVAHEMGHQWGANHTFNGTAGSCSGGNRNASTAYEPGSGSTIMAYAGICGSQNLQFNSDDYFHTRSVQEITVYSQSGLGNGCAVITPTGNLPPVPVAGVGGFFIPKETPFELTGSATDPDGNTITYCWEEYDLGPAGDPNFPSGNAPIFRSFDPVETPTRLFPKLVNILNNTQTIGEILPTYTRDLTFRLTVRDGNGGIDWDTIAFDVDANAGPFRVTSQNTTGIVWPAGSLQTITWDVAGTDQAPINVPTVDIFLSTLAGTDGFPVVLATNTPNDGSEDIIAPSVSAFLARLKVKAANSVFFDVNDQNFQITETAAVSDAGAGAVPGGLALHANQPNPFNPSTEIAFDLPESEHVTLRIYDNAGRLVRMLADATLEAGRHTMVWDGRRADGTAVASGVYLYRLESARGSQTRRMVLLK